MSKKAVKQSVKLLSHIRKEKIDSVKKCLSKGADLSYVDPATGFSALHLCASLDAHSCATLLLEARADPNLKGVDQRTPLHTAVVNDALMTFRLLVDAPTSDLNLVDKHDKSPLTLSILYQREHFVSYLFQQQARLNVVQKDSKQQSALHHACKVGYHRCINQLLAAGLDLNERNSNGNTPLHLAAIGGFSGCVAVLLTRGADGSITNSSGQTAAALAASMGYDNIVPLLRDSQNSQTPAPPPEEHARVSRRRSRSMGSVLAGMALTPPGVAQPSGGLTSSAGAALPPPPRRMPSITPGGALPPPLVSPPSTGDLPPPPSHPLLSPRQSRMSIRVAQIEVPDVLPPPRSSAVPTSPRTAAALPPAIGAQPTRAVQAPAASEARVSTPAGMPTRQRAFTTSVLPAEARHTIAAQPGLTGLRPPPQVARGGRGRGRGMPGRAPSVSPRATPTKASSQRQGLTPAASLPVLPGMKAPLTPPPQVSRGRRPPAAIPPPN